MTSRSSDLKAWVSHDALSLLLIDLHLEGTFFCSSQFDKVWSMAIPPRDYLSFHFVAQGEAWLQAPDKPLLLQTSDLALVPRSPRQVLGSDKRKTGTPVERFAVQAVSESVSTFRQGRSPSRWHVVCGGVRFNGFAAQMLLSVLPEVIVLRSAEADPIVATALAAMRNEAQHAKPGSATLMTRLADIIVIHALRGWLATERTDVGWLAALRDAQIGAAMAAVHNDPAVFWTVDTLARIARLSRSRFSQRFTRLMQTGPMQYVTKVRMYRARDLLAQRRVPVGELATQFGYDSEPAFARAFKRHMGVSPGSVRRSLLDVTEVSR